MKENLSTTLELAVARATGISGGSAHTIAHLLRPEVGGRSLLSSFDPRRVEDVAVDGAPCYVVKTRGPRGDFEEELWIERSSFLLRKLISRRDDRESAESRQNIEVDLALEESLFQRPG